MQQNKLNRGLSVLPIIITCLTVILIIVNILVPLMGQSIADMHAGMLDAGELFTENSADPGAMSFENIPNPAAHLAGLNVIILVVQLILLIIFLVLQNKHKKA